MYTDPISDMLTRIRNAAAVKKAEVILPHSNLKQHLADLLTQEGYLSGWRMVAGKHKLLALQIKYDQGQSVVRGLKRLSKPGQRLYVPATRIPWTNNGYGITVLSTSKGLMSDKTARKAKMGGELICQVW